MAQASARQPRVHDEPAFVLHRHDWSESSLILDVFSRQHGRVVLVAKGVKRPTSQFRAVLLPLQPLRLGWGGDAEVRTLKAAHWQGGQLMPQGDALLAGYYLNELLLKLLARDDPHPRLFDHYAQAVAALAQGVSQPAVLRAFELLLLRDTGLLPALDQEGGTLAPLVPQRGYLLRSEQGLLPQTHAQQPACTGAQWSALEAALQAEQPFLALCPLVQDDRSGALRRQLREVLHYHSGVRVFQTRQLLADVQRLVG
ncbi:DNA repair protein RecO [Tepidicella baoligensis]|uniref:DNA repair protein RecO n=1 Tax=Tepidicella baoligensis TaxID=2707016 RepID=UPI0015D9DEA4|nr:DNA repair protein RecO [Tepidicella baoligensis]